MAASAIAAFNRSKPELSGFPGLKHAISLSCIDKAQQRIDLIIISLSRSDHPAGTQRLYNVSFIAYLRYIICERLRHIVTTFVNERCFTYA